MTARQFVRSLSATGLSVLLVAALAGPARAMQTPPTGPDSVLAKADAGRIQGSPAAKVWLIEASDFQCPYCKEWHDSSYDTLIREYVKTGKVRFAFVNFPLNIHDHAVQAAEAAMCASAQGKFWEMHEALFRTQSQWEGLKDPGAYFDSLAVKTGVNAPAWRHCVAIKATASLIAADMERLKQSGVSATPTFFVGAHMFEGVQPLETLRKALDAAIRESGAP